MLCYRKTLKVLRCDRVEQVLKVINEKKATLAIILKIEKTEYDVSHTTLW